MTILECMEAIAKATVKHYYSDFADYDVMSYGRMYPDTEFIWVVRKYGTYILGIPSRLQGTPPQQIDTKRIANIREWGLTVIQHYSSCYNDNADFYYVKKDKRINKITATQARKIVELIG